MSANDPRRTQEQPLRPSTAGDLHLVVVDGPRAGLSLPLRGAVTVGASADNDLVLDDPTVSRQHCRLEVIPGGLIVRDLGSRNRTLVNGAAIDTATVTDRASIQVGASRMVVTPPLGRRLEPLVGEEPRFLRVLELLRRVARSSATVLLLGETGTGKTRLARELHLAGDRVHAPFVTVDCATLPPTLIESELFGHERGAFTDAVETHVGAFERADGGVLFLDEIGELDLAVQGKFLRAIEDRTVRRLGAITDRRIDVRLIAATNRDLQADVEAGRFRRDLYYRLDVIRIDVPPLRARAGDIPHLALQCARQLGASGDVFAPEELTAMVAHPWPGNVRELFGAVERALVAGDRTLLAGPPTAAAEETIGRRVWGDRSYRDAKRESVLAFERRFVAEVLEASRGNVLLAARLASMDRNHLRELIARHRGGGERS